MITETGILRLVLIFKIVLLLMRGGLLAIAPLVSRTAVHGIIRAAEKPGSSARQSSREPWRWEN